MNVAYKDSDDRQQQQAHAAKAFIARYGDGAWHEALLRVAEFETLGEHEHSAFWSEIADLLARGLP